MFSRRLRDKKITKFFKLFYKALKTNKTFLHFAYNFIEKCDTEHIKRQVAHAHARLHLSKT